MRLVCAKIKTGIESLRREADVKQSRSPCNSPRKVGTVPLATQRRFHSSSSSANDAKNLLTVKIRQSYRVQMSTDLGDRASGRLVE